MIAKLLRADSSETVLAARSTSDSWDPNRGFDKRRRSALAGVPDYRDPFGDGLPGPYLTLRVEWEGRTRDLLALVDTGADITRIPDLAAQALLLEQVDVTGITSSHGETTDRPVYVANLDVEGLTFPATWVVGDDYPIALIGRDVLNDLIAHFDSPARTFELQLPTSAAP